MRSCCPPNPVSPSYPDQLMTPEQARQCFPITTTRAYLFSGGLAPAATSVREAHDHWTDAWMYDPAAPYADYQGEWEVARQRFATLIGAEPAEVALVDHTSRGSNLIVQMLEAPAGSNVVVDEYTYPSSIYPWLLAPKAHVELRQIKARDNVVDLDEMARAVDERTFAISVTHVSPKSGFRHDLAALAELAHAHGAVLIVDAAQSAGVLDLDVRSLGVDFLTTCAMKWLLGAPGVGFLYIAREHVDRLAPPHVGYAGVRRAAGAALTDPLTFQPGARRHEQGMPSLAGVAASRAGLDLLLEIGTNTIEPYVLELSGQCIEGLSRRDVRLYTRPEPEHRAGVVALPVVGGGRIVAFMRERAVDIWTDPGETLLRIDPHVFNNADDLARCFAGIDDFRRQFGQGSLQG
jgi:cysteine desulfurase/selenocysteine lyase